MQIRPYQPGEEARLRAIFHSSVHGLASRDYTAEQLIAWAPEQYDEDLWEQRMRANQSWVAEVDGELAAFSDLQPSGYIDMFFVAAPYAGRGIGGALLRHIFGLAAQRRIAVLRSDVSLTAEPLFTRHGFTVETRNQVAVRGELLANATMRKLMI
ncbi:GNAT family N-acetyltransferase [Pseudoduganella sp. LjRoot289]|uniref:GNAT family N-acetyltransferase n=1 Tax=Pseudoduganella sp. LjRoot289 TaxID=3342314 RepID=UPI003ED107C5